MLSSSRRLVTLVIFARLFKEIEKWILNLFILKLLNGSFDHTSCNIADAVKEVDAVEDQVRRDFANGVSSEITAYNICTTRHIC